MHMGEPPFFETPIGDAVVFGILRSFSPDRTPPALESNSPSRKLALR